MLVVMVDIQLCICQNHMPQRVNFIAFELKGETEIDLSFKEDRIEEKRSIYKPCHPTEGVLAPLPAKKNYCSMKSSQDRHQSLRPDV